MKKVLIILGLAVLFLILPLKPFAQQPRQIKVSELNVSNIQTMEERVFVVHTMLDRGYICYKNPTLANTIDVYVQSDAADELSDFDFFLDNYLYDQLDEFSYLDKTLRGELYVEWRQGIDDEVYRMLYDDFTHGVRTDNATCETSFPFCTDVGLYDFPAGVNSGSPCGDTYSASCSEPYKCSGTPGQSTYCLSTAPNPAFYYLRIDEPGDLNIYMHSTPQVDIDFDCWGPFDDINTACDLLACSNIVDCSYSTAATEYCHINNAQTGQFYILLITNYSNQPCNISFENVGTGTTDCSILPPLVNGGGPYCVGETIQLTAQNQAGATFSWSGPNGFHSTQQNPTLPNCTLEMEGVYTCTITVGGESSSTDTEYVSVSPMPSADFTFVSACEGSPIVFTSTSTTNPAGQPITSFEWDFGDGQTGSGQSISHTYDQAGNYEVTLLVGTEANVCTDQKTQSVTVFAIPVATASANPVSVMYGGSATLTAVVETPGNYAFHWEPANMVLNPNAQTTQTVTIEETQVFTVTITNLDGGCSSTSQVTVIMAGSNMSATISSDQSELCQGESTTLHAHPVAGTEQYSYNWTPAGTLNNAHIQNPIATPPLGTTTYSCTINDGLTTQVVSIDITVHAPDETEASIPHLPEEIVCDSALWDSHNLDYTTPDPIDPIYHYYTESNTYHRTYHNQYGCDSTVTMRIHLEYTPNPIEITPVNNPTPHWVVTATEFQINSYEFRIWETEHPYICHWDSITWQFENPEIGWLLVPDLTTVPAGKNCTMHVLDYVEDTIWLRATVYNKCARNGIPLRYWFVCSYYDVEEQTANAADINVIPNPNTGNMSICFGETTGPVCISVYNMQGVAVDKFSITPAPNSRYAYSLDGHKPGIYLFVFDYQGHTQTKRIIIE